MTPVSRDYLRNLRELKAEEDRIKKDEERQKNLFIIVKQIYDMVLKKAENTDTNCFRYQIPNVRESLFSNSDKLCDPNYKKVLDQHTFYINNMSDILAEVSKLFPESSIKYVEEYVDSHGEVYDVSFVDRKKQEFIVVDWS